MSTRTNQPVGCQGDTPCPSTPPGRTPRVRPSLRQQGEKRGILRFLSALVRTWLQRVAGASKPGASQVAADAVPAVVTEVGEAQECASRLFAGHVEDVLQEVACRVSEAIRGGWISHSHRPHRERCIDECRPSGPGFDASRWQRAITHEHTPSFFARSHVTTPTAPPPRQSNTNEREHVLTRPCSERSKPAGFVARTVILAVGTHREAEDATCARQRQGYPSPRDPTYLERRPPTPQGSGVIPGFATHLLGKACATTEPFIAAQQATTIRATDRQPAHTGQSARARGAVSQSGAPQRPQPRAPSIGGGGQPQRVLLSRQRTHHIVLHRGQRVLGHEGEELVDRAVGIETRHRTPTEDVSRGPSDHQSGPLRARHVALHAPWGRGAGAQRTFASASVSRGRRRSRMSGLTPTGGAALAGDIRQTALPYSGGRANTCSTTSSPFLEQGGVFRCSIFRRRSPRVSILVHGCLDSSFP